MANSVSHCWHPTGIGTTDLGGTGGSDDHVCCWCGLVFPIMWRSERTPLPKHGQHFMHKTKVVLWPEHLECSSFFDSDSGDKP